MSAHITAKILFNRIKRCHIPRRKFVWVFFAVLNSFFLWFQETYELSTFNSIALLSNHIFNPFSTSVPLPYPLKTSENQRFSDVFRGYRSETLVENGLRTFLGPKSRLNFSLNLLHFLKLWVVSDI